MFHARNNLTIVNGSKECSLDASANNHQLLQLLLSMGVLLVHPASEREQLSLAKATNTRTEVRMSNRVLAQLDWGNGNITGR